MNGLGSAFGPSPEKSAPELECDVARRTSHFVRRGDGDGIEEGPRAAEGPDAVEMLGRASPSPSSPPLPTSLAPDDDARARLLEKADALSEILRVVAEATDALPEGALLSPAVPRRSSCHSSVCSCPS